MSEVPVPEVSSGPQCAEHSQIDDVKRASSQAPAASAASAASEALPTSPTDSAASAAALAQRRRTNVLLAYQAFSSGYLAAGASAKGLESAFAGKLQVSASMWSMVKSGSRAIGHKLARQIETHLGMDAGHLDTEQPDAVLPPSAAERALMDLALQAHRRANSVGRRRLRSMLLRYPAAADAALEDEHASAPPDATG